MGKMHMGFTRAGKVRHQTPKVEPEADKQKKKQGRSGQREKVNQRNQKKISENEFEKNMKDVEKMEEDLFLDDHSDPEDNKPKEFITLSNKALVPMYILSNEPSFEIDKSLLMKILSKENQIRNSEDIQRRYTEVLTEDANSKELFAIDRSTQVQALEHFGYSPLAGDNSLEAYQVSCGLHLEDPEVKNCVVWMKYDKMRMGNLRVGDPAPDSRLITLEGTEVLLSSFHNNHRPLVLIAGSYS